MSRKYGRNPRHEPFTVEAELLSAPVVTGPLLLDGILHYAVGAVVGDGVWCEGEDFARAVRAMQDRALATIRQAPHWWYAASQVTPVGPERKGHLHRRPAISELVRWTPARSVTIGSGPDKSLRVPYYTRTTMLRLRWTGVGDVDLVASLLAHVPAVGAKTTHGHGWVKRWDVRRGGPPFGAYSDDVRLRHLPQAGWQGDVRVLGRVASKYLPLTPPYHERRRGVPVVQVPEELCR